jgi:hypothetical protein
MVWMSTPEPRLWDITTSRMVSMTRGSVRCPLSRGRRSTRTSGFSPARFHFSRIDSSVLALISMPAAANSRDLQA